MQVSTRFLSLLHFQLAQFADRSDVSSLVVYVTQPGDGGPPSLVPIGQWPRDGRALPTVAADSPLRMPAEGRRWLPLRQEQILLGAIQVETNTLPWPDGLSQRLQAVALCLTEALCLDLDQKRLAESLNQQQEQLALLVHQLRNPLAALRTFGQLLLRRLEQDSLNRPLVEGLLAEERQLNRYVEAIDELQGMEALPAAGNLAHPLLLPPTLSGAEGQPLADLLIPLLQRASATAALQQRAWHPPEHLPDWCGDSGSAAEVLANLLENAFRYSQSQAPIGLYCQKTEAGSWLISIWDGGEPIANSEREAIFGRGFRGQAGQKLPGTGVGLALARDLARSLGGDLVLLPSPAALDPALPARGNAFQLSLPAPTT
ncbi:HAMP domain-containing histidine kinase [Cyanobium sp. HWJ4-Hawea]|uniref:sensor histidine kinase n=1 Tax=Cyanobium sp. HWJ4-Hawea TaxID=2823713 RepID=UPI0020CBE42E|nr:HAMP domain-containing sensor histidine kinase [Cyanobium sp. HWJ4-Hawea]MCP9809463.1 HAMP domain-containing histidine kinase [Cyanobium sp. HWJ4-Hawea]